ncbi:cellulose biosynthesis protein BcsQ [Novosphingobium sp. SG751A]|uniref:ParA family protein n=1 Tax=Novosphingobium sp. SG751A TaxID=2587000 RepID=UPI001553551E|nr:ParA family protein [Novosphingobium sp. SG751A]NOW47018.1 cellulose biosynthesis protein BcsQ [Novosphingobium sp. SG751A]
MAVIAVYSSKGGVGKTTLAVDLAWRSAALGGNRTLLWDLDVQGGAGFLLGMDEAPRMRAASLFQREGRPEQLIEPTPYAGLSLLRADDSLRGLPVHLARLGQKKRLAQLTWPLRREFSRIILDCPPMQNEVSEQIIAAADVLIVPLPASPLAARALDLLRRDLLRQNGRHPPLLPVLSMYDARRKGHRAAREGRMAPFPVIPMASMIEQTAFRRAPIGTFAPNCEPARALDRLWRAIEVKLMDEEAA